MHDLALDQQVGVERERVERDVDRALDRVLERHEAEVDVAGLAWPTSTSVIDGSGDQLAAGEVGLGEQRLLGERAGRPEIADRGRHESEQDR